MDTRDRKSLPALSLLPLRWKEVPISNANTEGWTGPTSTLKHIYLSVKVSGHSQPVQVPLQRWCFAIPLSSLLAFSTNPRLVSNSLSENWLCASVLSSLAGHSHLRTESFQILPPPTLFVHGPEPTSHRCSVTGCGQPRTGPDSGWESRGAASLPRQVCFPKKEHAGRCKKLEQSAPKSMPFQGVL